MPENQLSHIAGGGVDEQSFVSEAGNDEHHFTGYCAQTYVGTNGDSQYLGDAGSASPIIWKPCA